MSRVGKNPVPVPSGVTLAVDGHKVKTKGKLGELSLPLSALVEAGIDDGKFWDKPTAITITGADKQRVGQVAAEIRSYRGPEPYKGKGIKYDNETILRKEG